MSWPWAVTAVLAALALALGLLSRSRVLAAAITALAGLVAGWTVLARPPTAAVAAAVVLLSIPVLLLGLPPLRRRVVSPPLMPLLRRALPTLGDTERVALEAGTVWWDADLFSGRPDWSKLFATEVGGLSEREQELLDGPVAELCSMVDEWSVMQQGDLPEEAWSLIREHRLWGMIIPEEHGGLGFSAAAQSAVIVRLASRSITLAVTVMVPNSLGPAELLLKYGTDAQRRHYLPRLATGEEVPCFALTGPEAGSDAAPTCSASSSTGTSATSRWDRCRP